MDVGNQTSVTVVGVAGGLTTLGFWVLGYFAPAFIMSAPAGAEAAATTVLVGVLCYVLPYTGEKKPPAP